MFPEAQAHKTTDAAYHYLRSGHGLVKEYGSRGEERVKEHGG